MAITQYFVLLFLLVLCVKLGYSTPPEPYNYGPTSYLNQAWMSQLDDGLLIRQMSIPGTRNSIQTMGCPSLGSYQQKQTNTILQQLQGGIRALDLQFRHQNDRFQLYDRTCSLARNLNDVLTIIQGFLTNYPSQTVLLHLFEGQTSIGCTRTLQDTLNMYKTNQVNLFWSPTTQDPQLGEVRGKILILQQFASLNTEGLSWSSFTVQQSKQMSGDLDLYDKWTTVKSFISNADTAKNSRVSYWTGQGASFPYFVASGKSSPTGSRLLTGYDTSTHDGYYPDFPRISCFACTCQIAFEGINYLGYNYIVNQNIAYTGIVYVDFYGDDLAELIIGLNNAIYSKCTLLKITQGCKLCELGTGGCLKCRLQLNYVYDSSNKECDAATGYYLDTASTPQLCSTVLTGCSICQNSTYCTNCSSSNYILSNGACILKNPTNIQLSSTIIKDQNTLVHKLIFPGGLGLNNTLASLSNDLVINYNFVSFGKTYQIPIPINSLSISPDRSQVYIQTSNVFGVGEIDFSNSYFSLGPTSSITDGNGSIYVSSASYYPLMSPAFLQSYYKSQKNNNLFILGNILCIITFILLIITVYIRIKHNSEKQYHEVMAFVMSIYCVGFIRMRVYKFPLVEVIQLLTGFSCYQINFAQNIFNPQYNKLVNPEKSYLPIDLTYDNQSFLGTSGNSFIAFLAAEFLLLIYFVKVYATNKQYQTFKKLQELVLAFFMVKFLFASLLDYASLSQNSYSDYDNYGGLYITSLLISLLLTVFYLAYLFTCRKNLKEQLYKFQNVLRLVAITTLIIHNFAGLILLNIIEICFLSLNLYFYRQNKINSSTYLVQSLVLIFSFDASCFLEGSIILAVILGLLLYGVWGIKVYYLYNFFTQKNSISKQNKQQKQGIQITQQSFVSQQSNIDAVKERHKTINAQELHLQKKNQVENQGNLERQKRLSNATASTDDKNSSDNGINFSSVKLNQDGDTIFMQNSQMTNDNAWGIDSEPNLQRVRRQSILVQINPFTIQQVKQPIQGLQNQSNPRKKRNKTKKNTKLKMKQQTDQVVVYDL